MIDRVLVDSSFLIAQLDERDTHHKTAKSIHELFRSQGVNYLYLDCVVNETITVLARRARERKVDPVPIIRRVRGEFPSGRLTWTGPELGGRTMRHDGTQKGKRGGGAGRLNPEVLKHTEARDSIPGV